jgi:hypothetical protein
LCGHTPIGALPSVYGAALQVTAAAAQNMFFAVTRPHALGKSRIIRMTLPSGLYTPQVVAADTGRSDNSSKDLRGCAFSRCAPATPHSHAGALFTTVTLLQRHRVWPVAGRPRPAAAFRSMPAGFLQAVFIFIHAFWMSSLAVDSGSTGGSVAGVCRQEVKLRGLVHS